MNETIKTMVNHRTIRKFTDQKLTDDQIQQIIQAASFGSTSSYLMAYSIIGVTDPEKKSSFGIHFWSTIYREKQPFFTFLCRLSSSYDRGFR